MVKRQMTILLMTILLIHFTAMMTFPVFAEEATAAATVETTGAEQPRVVSRQELLLQELIARIQPPTPAEEPNRIFVSKEPVMIERVLAGEISGKGANGIAVAFERDSDKQTAKEMWVPFAQSIQLQGYKSRSEIKEGDKVKVVYEEADDGSSRILKSISKQNVEPAEEAAPTGEVQDAQK